MWDVLSDGLEDAITKTGTPESDAPSVSLHLNTKADKKALGTGPYPEKERGTENGARTGRFLCGAG